ncbi:DUF4365 domain-containing protein [Amycolatopsis sp. NPDC098790]|uniref:DUF4365 domain-containing protein n=1 Tax=Amycolatopsis sp. NPDC098790 TaxID=3363939 RepID=UPI003824DA1C
MTPSDARLTLVESIAFFGDTTAKARYGLAYLRSICSQAGVGFNETSPDEDVFAVDADVKFPEGTVSVQVKCTGGFKIGGNSASWHIEPIWRDKWNRSKVPVYFVLVILDPDLRPEWVTQESSGTSHQSAAFWVRVDNIAETTRLHVPKENRLSWETLLIWRRELLARFVDSSEGLSA